MHHNLRAPSVNGSTHASPIAASTYSVPARQVAVWLQGCRNPLTGDTHPDVRPLLEAAAITGVYVDLDAAGTGYVAIVHGPVPGPIPREVGGVLPAQSLAAWAGSSAAPRVQLLDRQQTVPLAGQPLWPGRAVVPAQRWLAEVVCTCMRACGAERVTADEVLTARVPIAVDPDIHRVADEVVDALARDPDIYVYGGRLVMIAAGDDGRHRIVVLTRAAAQDRISRVAALRRGWAASAPRTKPDRDLADAVLARADYPSLPRLRGIVTTPSLRPDGTLLVRPGYDVQTGLYLGTELQILIPDAPTREQCMAAAARIHHTLSDFPFAQPHHWSAALAAILTPLARPAIDGPCPLFLIDAPTPSTGKGLLASVVQLIATGQDPAVMHAGSDAELEKRITALVLSGVSIAVLDNIATTLDSPALDAALTARRWQGRRLGASDMLDLPLEMTWLATGNNVQLGFDTVRRVCPIRLDSGEEFPEARRVQIADLRGHIRANRAVIVAYALTILRGYCAAGRPQTDLAGWGSYEAWSRLIRQCLVWLGLPDPALGRDGLRQLADPQRDAQQQLLAGWSAVDPGGKGLTATELIELIQADPTRCRVVREALLQLAGGTVDHLPSPQRVGKLLSSLRDRVVGGLLLVGARDRTRLTRWYVRRDRRIAGSDDQRGAA